ncbi:TDT family transporter [Streptomyces sp. NPDC002309]
MVTTTHPLPRPTGRARAVRHLGPNWYSCVMGTAVVATAGAALPVRLPGLRTACAGVWALSLVLLAALLLARALHWIHHRDQARAHLLDPAMAPFHGCAAMALVAVGAATVTVGRDWIGTGAAAALDAVLFTAGTVLGLTVAVAVPYLLAAHGRLDRRQATPVWLLPLVAPMVSAAAGPLLVPYLPHGPVRTVLPYACAVMAVLSLLATLLALPVVFARLLTAGPLPLALTPTLFLVLGPLGQSTTAVGTIVDAAPFGDGVLVALYGVPVLGFALLWAASATVLVLRARRGGMRFSMTWWAFTFPVGTCVTGAEALGRHTGLDAFDWLATGLYVVLVAAWAAVAVRTARGLLSSELPAGPRPAPAAPRRATVRTTSGAVR